MNEYGIVNETGIQSLKLPRPDGTPPGWRRFCISLLTVLTMCGVYIWTSRTWVPDLALRMGWQKSQAELVIGGTVFILVWVVSVTANIILSRKKPLAPPLRLVLERRGTPNEVQEQHFEVWRADSLKARALRPFFIFLLGACFLLGVPIQPSTFKQVVLGSIAILLFYASFHDVETVQKPLFLLNAERVQVGNRIFDWEPVQKLKIEHFLDANGAYLGTSWTFVDEKERRIACATTLKDRCSQGQEEEMLVFMAQMLGNKVSPVVHSAPDWL